MGGGLSCGANYPNYADSWLVYGPFSLVGATSADLTYKLWLNSANTNDRLCRMYSIDGGSFTGYCTVVGTGGAWVDKVLGLTDTLSQSNVWVALIFQSDGSITSAEGAYVDNIVLRKCNGVCPAGAATGLAGSQAVDIPATMTLKRQ